MSKTNAEFEKSMKVAEASRDQQWAGESFLRELFLGRLRMDLIAPFPGERSQRPEFRAFYDRVKTFLKDEVDPAEIDRRGEYPPAVVDGLRALGVFGMKIPVAYGGLGLSQIEYAEIAELFGSYDGNLAALVSAHQSIGLPQPLRLFGNEAQKREYLPRCARGAISAFALTETAAGSDPAKLATTAEPTDDGKAFVLNGAKLWCTNGTLAELLVVMARNPKTDAISAFIVETSTPGVEITHRCHFMGLRALANAAITFRDVRVPRENLIGAEGKGLKIALTTLNTGRLTLPAAVVGTAKQCLEISRKWAAARAQWGQPIGRHETIAHKLADMAGTVFAMESLSDLVQALAMQDNYDIRLEAAAAKEWNTVRAWELVDETLQIRGGRGYETEDSLEARGEPGVPVERMMRDSRINRIFEGSSEIMHLFMAREAVDKHLQVAGALIDPHLPASQKLAALPSVAAFYAAWYPTRWVGWGRWPRYQEFGPLATHVRFVDRAARKLSRQVFNAMVVYQGKTQFKQAYLFRLVDIANELLVIAASASRANAMRQRGVPEADEAVRLASLYCTSRRRVIRQLFHELWHNDDALKYRFGRSVLEGRQAWLEKGSIGLGFSAEDLRPHTVQEILERPAHPEHPEPPLRLPTIGPRPPAPEPEVPSASE